MPNTLPQSIKTRSRHILNILRAQLAINDEDFSSVLIAKESHDPFRVLVATILSQSCTDISALRAYKTLDQTVGVTPIKLSAANTRTIERAIRVAGLHRQKAKAIKKLSQTLSDQYTGNLNQIIDLPVEKAREKLQELPKVGPKTADVLLSIYGKPTISIDTHVERVSKRLGFTETKSKYEQIRSDLMQLFHEEEYNLLPLLFMAHGRTYCKALRPHCPTCPVMKLCPYTMKTRR